MKNKNNICKTLNVVPGSLVFLNNKLLSMADQKLFKLKYEDREKNTNEIHAKQHIECVKEILGHFQEKFRDVEFT